MNTTSNSVSEILLATPYKLNVYIGTFLWIAGNFGCLGNLIVFRSRTFFQRAYSIYLLLEALSSLIYFDFLLLTRILQRGFQIPITTRFDPLCKLRQFDSVWNHVVSLSLFTLALVDRILSLQQTDAYRKWSNRADLAYRLALVTVLFWLLFFGHRLVLYSTTNNQCIPRPGVYAVFDEYIEACVTAMCTPIVMIILGICLLRSVRSLIKKKIIPMNESRPVAAIQPSILKKIDSQLAVMLLVQIIIALTTRIPYATYLIYSNLTRYQVKSAYRTAVENITSETVNLMSYSFFTSSFYVSLMTNNGFRRIFKKFIRKYRPKCNCKLHKSNKTLNGIIVNHSP
ncbi:unnamed protein product [Adineta ricciae]|uniref:G-protein coupled receptors family 1 profile domain-containing protein n=1 Tax=Adineta ricciae TaxID=249248 RepID=A0A813NZG5_ADIRI|nr:unnamed protein product [Adineta ricciae]CAF1019870.1 unnamed protein product [Adineta ricciae]